MSPFAIRSLRAFFTFAALACLILLQPKPSLGQSSPSVSTDPKTSRTSDPVDQELFVSYWTTETGWRSELHLSNNLVGQDLTVAPVLRTADGSETPLAAVTIKPQEVKTIDIQTAMGNSAPQLIGTYGSMVLRYHSPSSANLYAVTMIRSVGHPFAFHIDAMGQTQDYDAGSREGIWWLPRDTASDYLVLTNQGSNTLQLQLSLYDANGNESKQSLALAPRAMIRYSVRQLIRTAKLTGSYGGIKVQASAHAGSLDTLHVLFDERAPFSAILKMFDQNPNATLKERDYAKTKVWTLRAPMLALCNPDPALAFPQGTVLQPQLFVRNTTRKVTDVALRFNWRNDSATGKATGPALRLKPYETRRVDVAALQDGNTLPKGAPWTSVILTTNGLPDEVMAVAASYDATLRYGAQTPFSDQLSRKWAGGHWEYDPQHDSLITAGNGGANPIQAAFTIYYNQGTQKYELEQALQPDEQMWIDVGKLIREHVPDKNGNALPLDLTSGSYDVRDLTHKGAGTLFEGKVIYDKTYGHVAYGCTICCGVSSAFFWSNPLDWPFGSTNPNGVNGRDSCSNTIFDVSSDFWYSWHAANTSIATVDTYGVHTDVSVGSTTSNASAEMESGNWRLQCPLVPFNPSGNDNVKPTISGPNTLWWFNGLAAGVSGYAMQITLTASSGGNGTSYQWAITAGSNKVSLSTSTSATVQVTSIGQSAQPNDVSITVTVGGLTSDPFKLTVRAPYTLGQDSAHTTPVYAQDSQYVWNIKIYYQILDNLLTPMPATVSANEHWTTPPAPDYTNEDWDQSPEGCGTTLSSAPAEMWDFIQGDFVGHYPPPVYNTQQNGPAVIHWGQEIRVGTCTAGAGPRVQTDTLQKYTDHAAHTGIISPAP